MHWYKKYNRTGRVRVVERLTAARTWETESGQQLTVQPGDVLLTDGSSTWSITSDEFAASYRMCGADEAERTGWVYARPAIPGEVIESHEGVEEAIDGDWVANNGRGYYWLIPGEKFAASYRLADQDS